jgi:thiol-disulfide isomerase/thioredoxin
VVIAAAVAAAVLLTRPSPAAPQATSIDPRAWSLPRLTGSGRLALASFSGRPLVLDFFASWCDTCETELPAFAAVAQQFHGRVAFAAVDSEETGNGFAMAQRTGIAGWPLARDVAGRELSGLRDALEPTPGMPVTAFYDSRGRLLHVQLGALSGDALTTEIAQLYHLRPS